MKIPPPLKRLCKKHKIPISPCRRGYRDRECWRCEDERARLRSSAVPTPGKRLCRKHNRAITPGQWRTGHRTSGCAKCLNLVARTQKKKTRRSLKWNAVFISCNEHLDRTCNKAAYVKNGTRKCGSCFNRLKDGSLKPTLRRLINKRAYAQAMERRHRFGRAHGNMLGGLKLFVRSTGFKLS